MKTYLLLFFSSMILPLNSEHGISMIGETPTPVMDAVCEGSVTLYDSYGSHTVVTQDVNEMSAVVIERAILDGCGCFTLHSMTNFRGRNCFLRTTGEHSRVEIGFGRVRSVSRVDC
eukprot:GFUD01098061.1.p1 GENE.GFUD01098061.1~~GFUD01098061.1.p1  ORF type:complete len:130 (+),score=19.17 GFUD01098061.1:43-390(+)